MADDTDTAKRELLVEIDDCLERAFRRIGKGSGRIVELTDALIAAVRAEKHVIGKGADETLVEAGVADIWAAEAQGGITQAHLDALIAAVRAENAQVRIAADEWQKCAREQATMIEELAERIGQLERKLADVYPELR